MNYDDYDFLVSIIAMLAGFIMGFGVSWFIEWYERRRYRQQDWPPGDGLQYVDVLVDGKMLCLENAKGRLHPTMREYMK